MCEKTLRGARGSLGGAYIAMARFISAALDVTLR